MTRRHVDIGVGLVAAAMTASVAVALAQLVGPTNAPAANAAPMPVAAMVDLAPLRRLAPFGRIATGPVDTSGLLLRGVMLAYPRAASTALIAAGGGRSIAYAIGDTLPGGAVVDAIEYDLVALDANGRTVTLGFPVARGASSAIPEAAGAPDVGSLAEQFGAVAAPGGFRVGAQPPRSIGDAGLKPGDLIATVDGQAVGDAARDRALLDDAVIAGTARVGVVRGNRRLAVDVAVR